jgi:segregation and condensation protein B
MKPDEDELNDSTTPAAPPPAPALAPGSSEPEAVACGEPSATPSPGPAAVTDADLDDLDEPGMAATTPAPAAAPVAAGALDFAEDDARPDLTADALPLLPVIEALLFSTDMPLSLGKLAETVGVDSTKPVKQVIDQLNEGYAQRQAAYRVEERAGGYQLLTLPQYADYIERLVRKKDEGRLTPASLETLAIVAYRQPIIRADVEAIRGVACGEMLRSLMEHNLIKIVGRAEIVGRPMLYGTTRYFLEVFGLANLKDLPKAHALVEPK